MGLVSGECGNLICELIKDPWKLLAFTVGCHHIGIDKYIHQKQVQQQAEEILIKRHSIYHGGHFLS
jgi:hypothetical protein